jgi:hypothetical protein
VVQIIPEASANTRNVVDAGCCYSVGQHIGHKIGRARVGGGFRSKSGQGGERNRKELHIVKGSRCIEKASIYLRKAETGGLDVEMSLELKRHLSWDMKGFLYSSELALYRVANALGD